MDVLLPEKKARNTGTRELLVKIFNEALEMSFARISILYCNGLNQAQSPL